MNLLQELKTVDVRHPDIRHQQIVLGQVSLEPFSQRYRIDRITGAGQGLLQNSQATGRHQSPEYEPPSASAPSYNPFAPCNEPVGDTTGVTHSLSYHATTFTILSETWVNSISTMENGHLP